MTLDDRRAVEDLYMNKILRIVVATSTLAVGVNLPAHTVVIRGVHTFQNNAVVEYSDLDVMQMLGRAGRPQFDKEGVAVILCENELEHKYRALVQGQTVVESSLHNNLPEHLNSEIGLGTITDISSAKGWLKSSFLYRRIQRNPRHYSMNKDENQSWEERVDEIVTQSVGSLRESELIGKVDEDKPSALRSTEYGDIMSKFYIRQTTMCSILALPEHVSMRTVLEAISAAQELADSKLRSSERSAFNSLRKHNDIRFEVKKLEKTSDKIFILIQAVLGGISLNDPEYKSGDSQMHLEAFNVFRHLPRIARAVVEVAITRKRGAQLKCGLELLRCFSAKAWEDRPVVLRQLESIGEKSSEDFMPQVLAEHGITSLEILRKQDALRIETLLNRKPPFGLSLLAAAHELPLYSLRILEQGVRTHGGRSAVEVELSISCKVINSESASASSKGKQKTRSSNMTAVFTLTSDFEYIDFRRIPTKALKEEKTFEIEVALEKPSQSIIVYITSVKHDCPAFQLEAYAGVTVSRSYRPNVASNEYPTRVTKPPSPMDIELEGLENCPELFSMEGIDENGEEIPPKAATIPVRDLTKSKLEVTVVSAKEDRTLQLKDQGLKSAWSPEPEKLPNGNYRCNHPCKAKKTCRHLCCREGLPKPPARSSKTHTSATQKPPTHLSTTHIVLAAHASNISRPKLVPVKPNKKPNAKPDRTLQDLEVLHKNTNVENNLKLPQGHRLKLNSPPRTQNLMHRKKKPIPDFNIEFSQVNDSEKRSYTSRELAELSDEELPDADDLFAPLTKAVHKRKRCSDDYDDPDMDFLIRTLPEDDARGRVSPAKETRNTRPIKRPKKPNEEEANSAGTPLFLPSTPDVHSALRESDDDDIEFISSPHLHSGQEPPTSAADDFDASVLDPQSFDVRPLIPDSEISTHSSEDDDSRELGFPPVTYSTRKESSARGPDVSNQQVAAGRECLKNEEATKDYMEEEFAMLEAWLNSSAVEIVS
ncbi:dead deah box dna helicase [Moniliophthora roreri]|nr:dead deah box dna helicase [Moniliophthora roreri]